MQSNSGVMLGGQVRGSQVFNTTQSTSKGLRSALLAWLSTRQKRLNFQRTHLLRIAPTMKQHKTLNPAEVSAFRT
jgi:hypothetical protein